MTAHKVIGKDGAAILVVHEDGASLPLYMASLFNALGLDIEPCTPTWTEGGEYPW